MIALARQLSSRRPASAPERARSAAGRTAGGRSTARGSRLAGLVLALGFGLGSAAAPLAAQSRDGLDEVAPGLPGESSVAPRRLSLHHTGAKAGDVLRLVVEGALPGEVIALTLSSDAPPSLSAYLDERAPDPVDGGTNVTYSFAANELGRVVLQVPLDDALDAERSIFLTATSSSPDEVTASTLELRVQPPLLVVAAWDETGHPVLERIDLRTGNVLAPALDDARGTRDMALSATGVNGYLLREGGLLEVLDTASWSFLEGHMLGEDADLLARSAAGGLAFALSRAQGSPFSPSADVLFLGDIPVNLEIDPMGAEVAGRRWALTDDGLSAFLAADDLVVRELDVLAREARGAFTVGVAGDSAILDMLVVGRTLHVITGRGEGRTGTLTTYDLDTGRLLPQVLDIAPRRLAALDDGRVLVIPEARIADEGLSFLRIVENGALSGRVAGLGTWLDGAAMADGALLLRIDADGRRHLDLANAFGAVWSFADNIPPVTRLVSAGHDIVVLLGDPSGKLWLADHATGELREIAGVNARVDEAFVVLP